MYRHCAVKDPDSTLDYGFDWGKHWLPEGVTISTSQWIVDPPLGARTKSLIVSHLVTECVLTTGPSS